MLTTDQDLYTILGVSRDATQEQIHEQYRVLVKKYHPDLHPGDKGAEAKMEQINEAYDVLGNEDQRQVYDAGRVDVSQGPATRPAGPQGFGPDAYTDTDSHFTWDSAGWRGTSKRQEETGWPADVSDRPFQGFRNWASADIGDAQLTGFLFVGRLLWLVFQILFRILGIVIRVLTTRLDDHDQFF